MEYWKVDWSHDFQSEPTTFYSEIGGDGYEIRKIQIYWDGRMLKSDKFHESGEIGLSEIPVGAIEDVASQPEFSAALVNQGEFEQVWELASWPIGNSHSS
ncbi:DUF6881 domain-containing protein [Streptomyces sp. NPDC001544]|uniref:DUF6881 domain-containing protein n=1 Tax=Streptomyces sp. NPDC001544 TaxID=3364584 RepID=UPI00368EE65E